MYDVEPDTRSLLAGGPGPEAIESNRQAVPIWQIMTLDRKYQRPSMHLLKAVAEHGTVDFVQQVLVDVDRVLRRDAHKVAIVCGVVDLAETQPVRHDRIPPRPRCRR